MNQKDKFNRFEELEAGRILGDLDSEERLEWEDLSKELDLGSDLSLELAAAAVEAELAFDDEDLPDSIAQAIRADISKITSPAEEALIIHPTLYQRLFSREAGWIAAALMATLFLGSILTRKDPASPVVENAPELSAAEAREKLMSQAGDLFESEFTGLKTYDQMSGEVVWSDERQEGYMTLTNLPSNDPGEKQYQLWIVDPSRDEKPVDGGVFDIPSDSKTATIPIRNPLAVNQPAAFVITLEQPGGVVVSKQEVVVALAKRL